MTSNPLSSLVLIVFYFGTVFACPLGLLGQGSRIQVTFWPADSLDPAPIGGVVAFAVCRNREEIFSGAQLSICSSSGWKPSSLGSCQRRNTCSKTWIARPRHGNRFGKIEYSPIEKGNEIPVGGVAVAVCPRCSFLIGNRISFCTENGWNPRKLGECKKSSTILLIGGYHSDTPLDSLEWFNPWYTTGNGLLATHLGTPRFGHISAVLSDDKVLIAGGNVGGPQSSVELFDPRWGTSTPGPSMTTPRAFAGSAAINGLVFVCGGNSGGKWRTSESSCEKFQSGVWSSTEAMSTPRQGLAMVAKNRLLYALGGYHYGSSSLVEEEEIFSFWTTRRSMLTARQSFGAAVWEHFIYACGGDEWELGAGGKRVRYYDVCEEYNMKDNKWTSISPMNIERAYFTLVTVGNWLVALGGLNNAGTEDTVEIYNLINKGPWKLLHLKLAQKRRSHTAVVF